MKKWLLALIALFSISAVWADPTSVKVGVIDDMSGPYAAVQGPGDFLAAQMAAEDFGGKVLGRRIEVLSGDHQNKADVGALIARRWYDTEDVDAIFGMGNSAVALAIQQITKEKNRIDIVTSGGTSLLTGPNCSPNGAHWTFDTYALSAGTVMAAIGRGEKTFFFITADYALGHAIQRDTTNLIEKAGGQVLGSVKHPLGTSDFSSYILQAQASKAQVVVFANAGADLVASVKTAIDFGLVAAGQRLAGTTVFLPDIPAMGLKTTQGMILTEAFYWDQNDKTREFSDRFAKRHGAPPSEMQAATYSGVAHYLKAVSAAGTDEATAVMAKIKELPVDDFMTNGAKVREDGRLMRDMYLLEVKKPEESNSKWDVLKVVATIPAADAWRPLAEGGCPLIK
jgi:branched-chain amino acid transport system substrate-binding protein